VDHPEAILGAIGNTTHRQSPVITKETGNALAPFVHEAI